MLSFTEVPDLSERHPDLSDEERWLLGDMMVREEAIRAVFGETDPPRKVIVPEDPVLLSCFSGGGIYAHPPAEGRPGWHYVTFGLSQPLGSEDARPSEDPDWEDRSGLGIELVLSTKKRASWAPRLLLDMVRYLLVQGRALVILPGHRIPYHGFQGGARASPITHLLATRSRQYPNEVVLPGGLCTFVHLVGITDEEIARARAASPGMEGSFVLAEVLYRLGSGLTTDPWRPSATEDPGFDPTWIQVMEARRRA